MTTAVSSDETLRDPGLRLRPLAWNDAEAVAQLIYDACAADGDAVLAVSPDELRHGWQEPGFNLATDAFVVETAPGRIVGYDEIRSSQAHAVFEMIGNTHPDFKGRGI